VTDHVTPISSQLPPFQQKKSYGTLFHTFLVLFAALNSHLDYNPFNASRFRVLASLVYLLYCCCTTIILLNLLIALMGDR